MREARERYARDSPLRLLAVIKSNEKGRPPPAVSAANLLAPKEADDGPATVEAAEAAATTGVPNQRSHEPARPEADGGDDDGLPAALLLAVDEDAEATAAVVDDDDVGG